MIFIRSMPFVPPAANGVSCNSSYAHFVMKQGIIVRPRPGKLHTGSEHFSCLSYLDTFRKKMQQFIINHVCPYVKIIAYYIRLF